MKQEFSFNYLMGPYAEGGTKTHHVQRTMGTLIDYLLNKKKYPEPVVGASILKIFLEMYNGRVFKGDGTYGSAGRELVTTVRQTCDQFNNAMQELKNSKEIMEEIMYSVADWTAREAKRKRKPWWKRMFMKKTLLNLKDTDESA